MNIEALLKSLSAMSTEDDDTILDGRDSDPFDSSWCELNDLVGGNETHPEGKDFFIKISTVTKQHEITSYIADDIDLIFRADKKGIQTPFLEFLKDCYSKGIVPYNRESIYSIIHCH